MKILFLITLLICLVYGQWTQPCLGEFQVCSSGSCVLFPQDCGTCTTKGGYMCPDRKTCASSAATYVNCPGIKGTHLDWTLSVEERVAYLVSHASNTEKIAQMTNNAPAMEDFYIPSYNWLNDDEHGVRLPHAVSFPDGCGLGATWSKQTMFQVGLAVGMEARGLHNGLVH